MADTPLSPEQIKQAEQSAASEGYVVENLVQDDQAANALFGGLPDETISARVRRVTDAHPGWSWNPGVWLAKGLNRVLNAISPNHGAKAEAGDLERAQAVEAVEKKALGIEGGK